MDEEIQRHLRKIKKDLLGQEHSDLRSCVKKVLDASPVDAIKEIFDCCLGLFEGNRQKAITKFFTSVIEDVLGRRLFQLALYMSCKRLIGDALEQLVEDEVEKQVASNMKDIRETETRPLPPSEGLFSFTRVNWQFVSQSVFRFNSQRRNFCQIKLLVPWNFNSLFQTEKEEINLNISTKSSEKNPYVSRLALVQWIKCATQHMNFYFKQNTTFKRTPKTKKDFSMSNRKSFSLRSLYILKPFSAEQK